MIERDTRSLGVSLDQQLFGNRLLRREQEIVRPPEVRFNTKTYIIESLSEEARLHLASNGFRNPDTFQITSPVEIQGIVIPTLENSCQQFHYSAGITYEDLDNAQETNFNNLFLVRPGSQRNQIALTYDVNYLGTSDRVGKILSKLAQEHKINIECVLSKNTCFGYPSSSCRHAYDASDDRLIVHFDCNHMGKNRVESKLDKLYEFDLDNRNMAKFVRMNPIPPREGGDVIYDTNGTPVAQVEDGAIYILVNIDANDYLNRDTSFQSHWSHDAEVLEKILTDAIPIAKRQLSALASIPSYERMVINTRKRLEGSTEVAIEGFSTEYNSSESKIRQLRESIDRGVRESDAHLAQYVAYQQKVREDQAALASIALDPEKRTALLRKQLNNIRSMPDVIGMSYSKVGYSNVASLEIFTSTIYIEHGGNVYRIGSFKLTIYNGTIKIENLSNGTGNTRSCPHPHVSRDGVPCWGNISEAIAKMLGSDEFEMLINLTIQFLKSYDSEAPHATISDWPKVEIENVNIN